MTSAQPSRVTLSSYLHAGDLVKEEFIVVPAAAGGHVAVRKALARKLVDIARRPDGHCFCVTAVVEDDAPAPYIQGMTGYRLVYLEAVDFAAWGEEDATTGRELTTDQLRDLRRLGWREPDSERPNFFCEKGPSWVAISEIVLATLQIVYGVTEDQPIRVTFFPSEPGVVYPGPTACRGEVEIGP